LELNWSTFVLEIVNFVILVWILQRFLYRPVLEVIDKRRAAVERTLSDASALRKAADEAKASYENRLEDWAKERAAREEELGREIDARRKTKLTALETELAGERAKAEAVEAQKIAEAAQRAERTAAANGAKFARKLLEQAGGEKLHERLVELFVAELAKLPVQRRSALVGGTNTGPIVVASAFRLSDVQREAVERSLSSFIESPAHFEVVEDQKLIAGLRVTLGATVLGMNVADDLEGFAELTST
jgi:F-type H+-transporting ATPase subunit b